MGSSIRHHLKTIIPVLLVITIIITSASVGLFSILKDKESIQTDNSVSSTPDLQPIAPEPVEKKPIKEFKSLSVSPLIDFYLEGQTEADAREQIEKIVETAVEDGFNTLEITINYKDTVIFSTENFTSLEGNLFVYFSIAAKRKGLNVIASVDLSALAKKHIAEESDIENISKMLSHSSLGEYCDTVIFKNCFITTEQIPESEYLSLPGDATSYDDYLNKRLISALNDYYFSVAKSKAEMAVGIEINESSLPENAVFNPKLLF
ncbi:MAG: hypothetical protein IIX60_03830, partial [Clostridia bacterium]|nr:hypothetical protein [Clostridia bacterium]